MPSVWESSPAWYASWERRRRRIDWRHGRRRRHLALLRDPGPGDRRLTYSIVVSPARPQPEPP